MISDLSNNKVKKHIKFEIRIQDSGYGISEENLSKLFLDFSRLDEHSKMNKSGTGLGLSICKILIEKLGGSVRVESEKGIGTTFIVLLKSKCKVARFGINMIEESKNEYGSYGFSDFANNSHHNDSLNIKLP